MASVPNFGISLLSVSSPVRGGCQNAWDLCELNTDQMVAHPDFDLQALYAALDAQRQARDMSWAAVTRAINGHFQDIPASRPIATSTIKGLRTKSIGEGDGILQMLIWLDRTPESFVPGMEWDPGRARLHKPTNKRLRFDTARIYAALDAQRQTRRMSWGEIESEVGVSMNSMKHLAKGGRTGFPMVMRIVRWLGEPTASFTRIADW
jgi:hypothetical protein